MRVNNADLFCCGTGLCAGSSGQMRKNMSCDVRVWKGSSTRYISINYPPLKMRSSDKTLKKCHLSSCTVWSGSRVFIFRVWSFEQICFTILMTTLLFILLEQI